MYRRRLEASIPDESFQVLAEFVTEHQVVLAGCAHPSCEDPVGDLLSLVERVTCYSPPSEGWFIANEYTTIPEGSSVKETYVFQHGCDRHFGELALLAIARHREAAYELDIYSCMCNNGWSFQDWHADMLTRGLKDIALFVAGMPAHSMLFGYNGGPLPALWKHWLDAYHFVTGDFDHATYPYEGPFNIEAMYAAEEASRRGQEG